MLLEAVEDSGRAEALDWAYIMLNGGVCDVAVLNGP